jgi:cellobiose epimerase
MNLIKKPKNTFLLRIILFFMIVQCNNPEQKYDPAALADTMEELLKGGLLKVWYPASIDTVYGGFLSDLSYDWKPEGNQDKSLVNQARHIWTCSQAAHFVGDIKYEKLAEYGFHALRDQMWDSTYGGFYSNTSRDWSLSDDMESMEKTAYGHAFTIYALASYFDISGDSAALHLAQETFYWLEKYSHDAVNKGYFDILLQDGSKKYESVPFKEEGKVSRDSWKDMNSSIHLMEAFTELYSVWPDKLVRERLTEMFYLVRDTIIQPGGYMALHLTRDWKPISFVDSSETFIKENFFYDHISFGHDMETAFLLMEAAHILGFKNDTLTIRVVKKVVDQSLATGWDKKKGGFYYGGYYFAGSEDISIVDETKQWWVQAEGLNTLLIMSKLYPENPMYHIMFLKQWEYIDKYLIDHEHGGWYSGGLDKSPGGKTAPKATIWKVNYHTMRTLMNCIQMLRNDYELTNTETNI